MTPSAAHAGGYPNVSAFKPVEPMRGQVYSSRTPPVIRPDSIIIACCGPTDDNNNSSPNQDGFFHSDFYYLHHLFKGACHQQYWMTCVSPETMVEKYEELLHGHPASHRAVVLDKDMLPDVQDVLTFPGSELNERFLAYIEDIGKKNVVENRPIVLMMFGHGSDLPYTNYGIHIGGKGAAFAGKTNIVTPLQVEKSLFMHNEKAEATILTVSCFGGGWTLASSGNFSAIAGVYEKLELWSWPYSASVSRYAGSRFITGIVDTMIRTELVGESEIDPQTTPTFAAFTKALYDVLVKEIDPMQQEPRFAAKDDKWMQAWRERTGLPLSNYFERLKPLRFKDPGEVGVDSLAASAGASGSGFMSMQEFRNTLPDQIEISESLSLPIDEARHRVKKLAALYLDSFPGPHEAARNIYLHRVCIELTKGRQMSGREIQDAAKALHFRLYTIVARANQYRGYLDEAVKPFPWCNQMDSFTMLEKTLKDPTKVSRYKLIAEMIRNRGTDVFDLPGEDEGHHYSRGKVYLGLALTSTSWDLATIKTTVLNGLATVKRRTSNIDATVRRLGNMRDPLLMNLLKDMAIECKCDYQRDSPRPRSSSGKGSKETV